MHQDFGCQGHILMPGSLPQANAFPLWHKRQIAEEESNAMSPRVD